MAWARFGKKKDMPGGLWIKCDECGAMLFRKEFEQRHRICSTCGHHFTLPARERIALTIDPGSFEEMWIDLVAQDVLGFNDRVPYGEKLIQTKQKTGEADAMIPRVRLNRPTQRRARIRIAAHPVGFVVRLDQGGAERESKRRHRLPGAVDREALLPRARLRRTTVVSPRSDLRGSPDAEARIGRGP